jgi:hypothetical protein
MLGSGGVWPHDGEIDIGGVMGGAVDDGISPVTMEVEHVRVWQAGGLTRRLLKSGSRR